MNEKQVQQFLRDLTENKAPSEKIDLWPEIESRFVNAKGQNGEPLHRQEAETEAQANYIPWIRVVATIALLVLIVSGLYLISPGGQGLDQGLAKGRTRFFTRSNSSKLPLQSFQLTRQPTVVNPTPDPANMREADMSIDEVQQLAGFKVRVPTWIPDTIEFYGASFDKEKNIVRISYYSLLFTQEQNSFSDSCELCGVIGPDATVKKVSINGVYGEYVFGVWELSDNGPVWKTTPLLTTLRWQENGMAFEFLYMGPIGSLTVEEMIKIAESVK